MPVVIEVPQFASLIVDVIGPMGTLEARATAFVVRLDGEQSAWLITNRHVATGRHWQTNLPGGQPTPAALDVWFLLPPTTGPAPGPDGEAMRWEPRRLPLGDKDGRPLWLEHPEHGRHFDAVALPLPIEHTLGVDYVSYPLGSTHFPTITSDVFVVGFPSAMTQEEDGHLAVWSRGTVASDPRLPFRRLPAYLIDSRTRAGQSGSPVIRFSPTQAGVDFSGEVIARSLPSWELLGAYSARVFDGSDLGIVWTADALERMCRTGGRPNEPDVPALQAGETPHP